MQNLFDIFELIKALLFCLGLVCLVCLITSLAEIAFALLLLSMFLSLQISIAQTIISNKEHKAFVAYADKVRANNRA